MTNVKKMLAAGLAAAAMLTAVLPAMAESGTQAPAMGQQLAMGGRGMRQGLSAGRGQMQQGQAPQQPDAASGATQKSGDAATGDTGSSTTQKPALGRGFGRGGRHGRIGFDDLLKDGVIDQETYDAIENYLKEKRTATAASEDAAAAPAEDEVPPETPAEGELPPEMPEGVTADGDPALLKLVEDGVITKEQYDAILAARAAAQPTDSDVDAADAAEAEEAA